jgi:hypothetical protein
MIDNKAEGAGQQQSETVFIAYTVVHLASGESFELLPFWDSLDVKSKVTDLLDDWAKSGYLVRGNRIYPWHQVRLIEATSVTELSRHQAEQQIIEWQAKDLAHMQPSFWKVKQARRKKEDEQQKDQGGSPRPVG